MTVPRRKKARTRARVTRLTKDERLARAMALVDDAWVDGKPFKGEAPILTLIRAKNARKRSA